MSHLTYHEENPYSNALGYEVKNPSDFGCFWLSKGISIQKAQESGKGGREKSKYEIFSETAVVVVKPF